jgi:hypothetical protein
MGDQRIEAIATPLDCGLDQRKASLGRRALGWRVRRGSGWD